MSQGPAPHYPQAAARNRPRSQHIGNGGRGGYTSNSSAVTIAAGKGLKVTASAGQLVDGNVYNAQLVITGSNRNMNRTSLDAQLVWLSPTAANANPAAALFPRFRVVSMPTMQPRAVLKAGVTALRTRMSNTLALRAVAAGAVQRKICDLRPTDQFYQQKFSRHQSQAQPSWIEDFEEAICPRKTNPSVRCYYCWPRRKKD